MAVWNEGRRQVSFGSQEVCRVGEREGRTSPEPRPSDDLAETAAQWRDGIGVVTLPGGARVRGRRLASRASPADFALVLASGPVPAWPSRRIRWPDFWIPTDRDDALDALHEAHRRALSGERVEAACHGGIGRTGTALAALAVLDGLTPGDAVAWVRDRYHPRAVETVAQRRWLRHVR
jgi:hypothetical protein